MNPFEKLPWRIRQQLHRLRAQSGAFAAPEQSARSRGMDDAWNGSLPGQPPLGHGLRGTFTERWVRFHSLPGSKRYADTPEERDEIFRRHRLILEQLHSAESGPLTVIAADWDWRDSAGGWTKQHLPGAWPWRAVREEDELPLTYFWVDEFASIAELKPLLLAVADDIANVTITTASVDWLYHPYDGGGDVIARTPRERDDLAQLFREWLPENEAGL